MGEFFTKALIIRHHLDILTVVGIIGFEAGDPQTRSYFQEMDTNGSDFELG
jgi:hypothetical protein